MATTVGGGFVYTSIVGPQGLDSVSGSGPPSPVLLPGLIGWALTAGPQQTLDSTGVISGGALDLTENAGTFSYNSNGAASTDNGQLLGPIGTVLAITKISSWLVCYRGYYVGDGSSLSVIPYRNDINDPSYSVTAGGSAVPGGPNRTWTQIYTDADEHSTSPPDFAENTPQPGSHIVFGWYDAIAQTLNTKIDNGPVVSRDVNLDLSPGWDITPSPTYMRYFPSADGAAVSVLRIWIGNNALTVANTAGWIDWLYNGGTGRTDAEVAAYTG